MHVVWSADFRLLYLKAAMAEKTASEICRNGAIDVLKAKVAATLIAKNLE